VATRAVEGQTRQVHHLQAAPAGPLANPAVPRTPDEIAREASACVAAGATLFHLHA
jgi:uncharacterized protein (DUF849 family)